jgi:hypothetical protein
MTRKHFETIAAVLAGEYATSTGKERGRVRAIALSLADVFARENRNFDRARFYVAVGLDRDGFHR